jgi:hypothetical protein
MRSLPSPRGPVSELLLSGLRDEPHALPDAELPLFFDEHVTADGVHENIAAVDLAGGLAHQDEALAGDILWGARALSHLDARWASHVLGCWSDGRTSLLRDLTAYEHDGLGNPVLASG